MTSNHQRFVCPLTKEVMREPVSTPDGKNYERKALMKWLQENDNRSPSSEDRVSVFDISANVCLQWEISRFNRGAHADPKTEEISSSVVSDASESVTEPTCRDLPPCMPPSTTTIPERNRISKRSHKKSPDQTRGKSPHCQKKNKADVAPNMPRTRPSSFCGLTAPAMKKMQEDILSKQPNSAERSTGEHNNGVSPNCKFIDFPSQKAGNQKFPTTIPRFENPSKGRRSTSEGALAERADSPPSVPRRQSSGDALLCKRVVASAKRRVSKSCSTRGESLLNVVNPTCRSRLHGALQSLPVSSAMHPEHISITLLHILDDAVSLLSDSIDSDSTRV